MDSSMNVGEIINALRQFPESYRVLYGAEEVAGVRKAKTHEEGTRGNAVVLELQPQLPIPDVAPDRSKRQKRGDG